jgi:hypothetical protein
LHCALVAAFDKWMREHHADVEEIVDMVAQAAGQNLGRLSPYRGKEFDVLILGIERAKKTAAERAKMN